MPAKEMTKTPEEGPTEGPAEEPVEEPIEEPIEEPPEEPPKKTVKRLAQQYRKFLAGGIILLFTLLIIYLGVAYYFKDHFYIGTEINGIDVSGGTVEDIKALMAAELNVYTLNLKERGGKIEQIKAGDVGLQFASEEELKKLKTVRVVLSGYQDV